MVWRSLEFVFNLDVLTCFLVMRGDLTGLMGEMDTLAEGETDLQRTGHSSY